MDITEVKKLASEANSEAWKFLSRSNLGEDERIQMLACSYSSLYLWARAGGSSLNLARGHWLISRVACVLDEKSLAQKHSKLCRSYTELATDRKDFDDVYALESEARVAALIGDKARSAELQMKAKKLASEVKDSEDRELVEGDLAAEPWFGLRIF